MIKTILTYYASYLDEYLRRKFPQPEGVAEVGFIGGSADYARTYPLSEETDVTLAERMKFANRAYAEAGR